MWGPEDEQLGGSEGQPEEKAPRRKRIWPTEQLGRAIKVDRTAAGAKAWRREAKALRGRGKLSAVGAQTGPGRRLRRAIRIQFVRSMSLILQAGRELLTGFMQGSGMF